MSQTVISGAQIKNATVQRQDLDTVTVGQAVVTKIVQGSGITLSSTGADSGTGDVTVNSPDVVSTDAGNIATLGSDNHILVPQSQIWSVRLRSFNAVGNPTFELDQRNVGTALTNPGVWIQDRWWINKIGLTGTINTALQSVPTAPIVVPGTNFGITQAYQRFTVGTAQASLAAGDCFGFSQVIEGPRWRELAFDVHSIEILVRSSVAGTFALRLRDPTTTHSLVKLCTIASTNTWTLVQLANLPLWVGTYSALPGGAGYNLDIFLACGSTYLAVANNAWQNGDIRGVTGMSNFLATAGATFDIAFIQHQPGAVCETPIDCPFTQNYDDCQRYYSKSLPYGTKPGSVSAIYAFRGWCPAATNPTMRVNAVFPKRMAKTPPNIFVYNPANGALNAVFVDGLGQLAVSTITASDYEIYTIVGSGTVSTAGSLLFDYAADSGW